jgi:dUTP pyrophosphatase
MKLKIKKMRPDAKAPTRAHHNDAGIDLYACGEHIVLPHTTATIPLGIAMEIEEGYVGLMWDKSSMGAKSMKTLGGVIDAGYRGEVLAMVHNLSNESYTFLHGHKVAQMVIQKVEFPEIEEVKELSDSLRGENGFGSTGK